MWLKDDGRSGPGQRYRCRAWRHLVPPFPVALRAYDRVRCDAMTLLLLAAELRSPRGAT